METVGIEPTSENTTLKTPTCVDCLSCSPEIPDSQGDFQSSLKKIIDVSQAKTPIIPPFTTPLADLGRSKFCGNGLHLSSQSVMCIVDYFDFPEV